MLDSKWANFKKENKALVELAAKIKKSEEKDFYLKVLSKSLPELLSADPDNEKIASLYDDILIQLKEYYPQLLTLANIDELIKGARDKEPLKRLSSLRTWSQLLTSLQNPREVRRLLNFRLGRWIREHFLEIADKILIRYQNTEPDKRTEYTEKLYQAILRVLAKGNLKPVEIIPGETPFDSKLHIARSTVSDPSRADKVIIEVQRNGFMLGDRMIQQPQVIINKRS